jgi:hypothetical protein
VHAGHTADRGRIGPELIRLIFRPVHTESAVLVRGTYFRICADGTLRGPDNAVCAKYADGFWELAHRRHRAFECDGPVYLRLTKADGRRERIGPYDFVKAAEGAIFTRDSCLGVHDSNGKAAASVSLWQEIAFLTEV